MLRDKTLLKKFDKKWLISALSGIGEAFIIADYDGFIEFANHKTSELLNLPWEQIIGFHLNDILKIHSEVDDKIVGFFNPEDRSKLLRSSLPRMSYIVNHSNEKQYISAQINDIQSTEMSREGYAIVIRDVSQFVQSELQITKEKDNIQKMFDLMPMGMIFIDENQVIQKANQYFYEIFGMREKNVVGLVFGSGMECTWSFEFGCGNAMNCKLCNFKKNVSEVIDEGKSVTGVLSQLSYRHNDQNATMWITFGVIPTCFNDIEGFMITLEDVTRQIEHEKGLESARNIEMLYYQSKNKYESLFKNVENSICYLKLLYGSYGEIRDAEIVEFNSSTYKLFNLSQGVSVPKHLSELSFLTDADIDHLIGIFNQVIKTKISCQIKEYYISIMDKWIELSIYSPEDDYIALLITDIDFKKKAVIELQLEKEKSEAANRAKRDFLANMSHEIRTPLNGIVGMIDLTLMDPLNHEQIENLNTTKECVDSLIGIINDVLDFSKIEAGKFKIEYNPFNIFDLVDSTYKLHQPNAGRKSLEIILNYESINKPYFIGDSNRIKQVLNNLINNAIKFTNRGHVRIDVYQTPDLNEYENVILKFVVSDTGIGIPLSKQSMLFKSFSQIDGSYTRQNGGTGLGLVISKQLTEMMGGTIGVSSKENEGTIFTVSIPMRIGNDQNEIIQKNEMEPMYFIGKNVLLVEDDKVNQIVMSKMLENAKMNIKIASNGYEAIHKCNYEVFDLILMDIQMPVLDGIEATRRIRQTYNLNQKTPIIALTAFALQGDEEIFRASGMDDYISKPVDRCHLLSSIDKHLKRSALLGGAHDHIDLQEIVEQKKNSKFVMNDNQLVELTIKINRIRQAMAEENYTLVELASHQLKIQFEELKAEELKNLTFKMELEVRKEKYGNVKGILDQIYHIVNMLMEVK